MPDEIILLIRSSCNSDDLRIEASLGWSVRQVKEQISTGFPTHPAAKDQRLVYAGKLLEDSSILRDVLRLEDGGHAFIIHLACRYPEMPIVYVQDQSLRRRPVAPSQASSQAPSLSSEPLGSERQQQFNQNIYGQFQAPPPTSFDQSAVLQQVYAQYVAQYMQYFQAAGQMPVFHPNLQSQAYHQPLQQVIAPSVIEQTPITASQTGAQAPPLGEGEGGPSQHVPQPQVEGALDQPDAGANPVRPNVVLNANAGALGAIGDDEEDGLNGERDILDWFYIATRVLLLFSIVYLYSSFSRFLLVAGFALILYLYQSGFFGPARLPHGNRLPGMARDQRDNEALPDEGNEQMENRTEQQNLLQPEEAPRGNINYAANILTAFFSSIIPNQPQVA